MSKKSLLIYVLLIGVVCCLLGAPAYCQRVLVVTTESAVPSGHMGNLYNGEYIIADLTAAGMPFDVVTYGRFVTMDLANHDIIMLSGTTTPTVVSSVAAKCTSAMAEGRKIFINGHWPYERLNANDQVMEFNEYSCSLFNVVSGGVKQVTGTPVLPATIEKDPSITAKAGFTNGFVRTYTFNTAPAITITIGGKNIGFLYPQGGAIDSYADSALQILDYGKVASYLRYGSPLLIGFANDRIGGKPIAAFEIHDDYTNDLNSISTIDSMSRDLNIPMLDLIVLAKLDPASTAAWNALTNPLMSFGSHTRDHMSDWTASWMVSHCLYETSGALTDQRVVIPATGNYVNFSGMMNLTTGEIDQVYNSGAVFGAGGGEPRQMKQQDGSFMLIQRLPTRQWWFYNLAFSTTTPFCLSQTLNDDVDSYNNLRNYEDDIAAGFQANLKYGMYSYGYFHDFDMDPTLNKYVGGVHMSEHIRRAMRYLLDHDATIITSDVLIAKLRDYLAGQIQYSWNPDGSASVTAIRPGAHANEIKIAFKDDCTPIATGNSIISQRLGGECLYVTLMPETSSTIQVQWQQLPPPTPQVQNSDAWISNQSVVTIQEVHPEGVAEYKYAVGTSAGGADAQGWTSNGSTASAPLTQAQLQPGRTYYVAAKARYSGTDWSPVGVSPPLIADSTPPTTPVVTDDGFSQDSLTNIHATWSATDPESGVTQFCYAIGTYPGGSDARAWTYIASTSVNQGGLTLTDGTCYYVSVKAENPTGSWSGIGSSDGIVSGHMRIGKAHYAPVGVYVRIADSVVTGNFAGGFYVQSVDRSAGFKVIAATVFDEGSPLSIFGKIDHVNGESVIEDPSVVYAPVLPQDIANAMRPMLMTNKALGGAGDLTVSGPVGGFGVNNVCLLVRTTGRISAIGTDYIYINDGSLADDGVHPLGVKVLVSPTTGFQMGTLVSATGISSLDPNGSTYRRLIKTRRPSDISTLAP